MSHLLLGETVRVQRPRSKYHGMHGEVTGIGYDQFRSTPAQFYYTVTFRGAPEGVAPLPSASPVTVPYDYVEVRRDNQWVTPDPLDPVEPT